MAKKHNRPANRPRKLDDRIAQYPQRFKTDSGLFLRIASLGIVAPLDYELSPSERLTHCWILHSLCLDAPRKLHDATIAASTTATRLDLPVLYESQSGRPSVLQDAGFFEIVEPSKKHPKFRINLHSFAEEYTQPDSAARKETVALFRGQLGAGFCIEATCL